MTKNIFAILNSDNKIWVDIFKTKYGHWNVWDMGYFLSTSWFFKSICKTAKLIKPNLLIYACNPSSVNLWNDPCIMDLPIYLKLAFINMGLSLDNMTLTDFIKSGCLDHDTLVYTFGLNLDWDWLKKIDVTTSHNQWVWGAKSTKTTLASVVYDYLNASTNDNWICWQQIWRLRVIPYIKVFIWELAHSKLPTGAYLYDLNIGPFPL